MLTKYPTISSALIFLTALVTSYAGNETKSTLTQSDDSTVISEDGIAALSISDTEKASSSNTPDESKSENYYILPDFVVSGERDRGYYSANSLAGTRTNQMIKNTPMTISVVNKDLIEDLNLYGIDDIAGLIASAETEEDGFTNRAVRFRGFRSNFQLFEFMPRQISQNGYNIDRADVVRGANSLIYGQAAPGGKINFLAKTARFDKDRTSFDTSVSDKDLFRVSFDHNQIINDKLAVRVMGVHEGREFNQDFKEKEFNGLTIDATYRPTEKTQIRLHLEGIDEFRNSPAGTYIDKTGPQGLSGIPERLPATPDIVDFLPNALLGSIFDAGWDWEIFWRNTAFFSLILAFMNLLPIPALDGGHVVFLLYEMVAGKPAPEKFLERAQMVGIVLLLTLMVYALGNDVWRLLTGQFS